VPAVRGRAKPVEIGAASAAGRACPSIGVTTVIAIKARKSERVRIAFRKRGGLIG
jgi:hypothetical protein